MLFTRRLGRRLRIVLFLLREARKEAQNSVILLSGRLRMRLRTVLLLFL